MKNDGSNYSGSCPEEHITSRIVTSRNRSLQQQQFRKLFRAPDTDSENGFDEAAKLLWVQLTRIAYLLRRRPGASMEDLVSITKYTYQDIRRCIRLLINFGGEIEVVPRNGSVKDGLFRLHN